MCPFWSPSGHQLAYVDNGDLVLIPATGGAGIKLATSVTSLCGEPESIAWSPDGQRIAFTDSKGHLKVADARTRLVWSLRHRGHLHGFAWSPDSRQIFFGAGNEKSCNSLWRVPVRGGKKIRVSRC
jgi:Tol biopolymer transport system component